MKKIIAILLAATLATTLLIGCAPAETEQSAPAEQTESETPVALATPSDESETADLAPVEPEQPEAGMSEDVARAVSEFGEKLHYDLSYHTGGNEISAPLSMYISLAMAAQGAKGQTLAELEELLGLPVDRLGPAASELLAYFTDTGETTLNIADSAWIDDAIEPDAGYLSQIKDYYAAQVFHTDLDSPDTVIGVNEWVSGQTNGLIPEMLTEAPAGDTMLMLLSTLYFDAKWQREFDPAYTYEGEFTHGPYVEDGVSTVEFMHEKYETQQYINTDEFEGVLLPYSDGRLGFVAVMEKNPDQPLDGEPEEIMLDGDTIKGWVDAAQPTENVQLSLPKFNHTYEFGDWSGILDDLGLVDTFDPDAADFTGIGDSPGGPLYISQILQKANIRVDEQGTRASASTNTEMAAADSPESIELVFNREFMYAVVDIDSGVPLLIGTVSVPLQDGME